MSDIGSLPTDLARVLREFFTGQYANQDFIDWNDERARKRQNELQEFRNQKRLDTLIPSPDDERERMLMSHEILKRNPLPNDMPAPGVSPPPPQEFAGPSPESARRFNARLAELQQQQSGGEWDGPSFAARLQPFSVDESMYEPTQVEPAYPSEGGFKQDEIMEMFKRMNPDFDYAAAAEQSGGNVPGGTLSIMPEQNLPPDQTTEGIAKFAREQELKNQLASMLDSRSRGYDPAAAELLLGREKAQQDASAQMIYSRAQELRAQAEADEVGFARKQAEMMNTPEGQMRSTVDFILTNVDATMRPDLYDKALRARVAINNGRIDEASMILQQITDATVGGPGGGGGAGADMVFSGGELR